MTKWTEKKDNCTFITAEVASGRKYKMWVIAPRATDFCDRCIHEHEYAFIKELI